MNLGWGMARPNDEADTARLPVVTHARVRQRAPRRWKSTLGAVLLWGFMALALAYAVFLFVLGLTAMPD